MSNLNMPVKYCTDENDEKFSPVVYQESMFNDDGTRMDPVPRKMFAKAYNPTKTYPTESLFCINDNKFYKFTGSGTTTGAFDSAKWTETDDATELTALNSTLTNIKSVEVDISGIAAGSVSAAITVDITAKPSYFMNISGYSIAGGNAARCAPNCLYMSDNKTIVVRVVNTATSATTTGATMTIYYI